ncbi:uncharacterized protein LOC110013392 isoform X2 [Oryzias latipes]|uniref:uncharacterized protein LOC110013392 isoform X2 n=1 Tax=Oryzias latipes TaxID=8090 RepID=UPI000CE1FDCC|nr:uncharacterized protein LOC110013392 isoform X2 [Oryzias latipes]
MKHIFGLLTILLGTSYGLINVNNTFNGSQTPKLAVETNKTHWTEAKSRVPPTEAHRGVVTHCDGRQNGAQCYGALGGTVSLQLMDDFSGIHRYQLKAKNVNVLSGRKDKPPDIKMNDTFSFLPSNGKFWIHNLSRNDSGEYRLIIFDSNGKQTKIHTLQLSVQAPVSSVLLVPECLSQGEMKVSCSSEGGDSPQYRWTLNGKSLTEAELLSGNKQTNIITLKQHVSGRLVCSSWNHVSSASKEINITNCGFIYINCTFNGTKISKWVFKENNTLCVEPTTSPTEAQSTVAYLPILVGVLSALLILLLVGIAMICTRKKKPIGKGEVGDQELIYADVRIVKQQSKKQTRPQPREDVDVEYGQVKFRERPQHMDTAADVCVYAMVQKRQGT